MPAQYLIRDRRAEEKPCAATAMEKPDRWPGAEERQRLLTKYETPLKVQEHCKAVAVRALELARQISGIEIRMELLEAAGELHDILKATGRKHAQLGAELMYREGYLELGRMIGMHHDLSQGAPTEGRLLYLADKLIQGTEPVTLETRFMKSKKKCNTPEALKAWKRRYQDAISVVKEYSLRL